MDVLKNLSCLNCGGEVTLSEDGREATCKYCRRTYRIGSTLKDSALISFAFATEYLKSFRFADAKRKFSEVASESPEFSEAWWGAFIAEYGIEFGRNRLGETVPTCHRAHTVKVSDDPSYKMAIETANEKARKEYISLGEKIEYVRSEIIEKAENGEIYDVFICFKATETDSGRKTEDYYLGRDIYHELKDEGYNVFFSAETLKRIGEQEFEPYIFRALSTARVMLVLCSDNEKLESAWVKNEWSRFLDMKGGKGLIPVCGNNAERYSPYDLPEELRRLNAIEFGGNLFEDLKVKTEAYFPERVKARTEAEKKAREAEYEAKFAREREAERQAREEQLRKQQEQIESLMKQVQDYTKSYSDDGGIVDRSEVDFDYLCKAMEDILESGTVSTSNIQRHLHIGFNRAADIVDELESLGFISPKNGSKQRDILIDYETFEQWKLRNYWGEFASGREERAEMLRMNEQAEKSAEASADLYSPFAPPLRSIEVDRSKKSPQEPLNANKVSATTTENSGNVIVEGKTRKLSPVKDKILLALICLLFGCLGIHNFLMGEMKKGVIKIVTSFCCGIGFILVLVDFFKIISGSYEVDRSKKSPQEPLNANKVSATTTENSGNVIVEGKTRKLSPVKDKIALALICLLFGGWGIHNFLMGEMKKGVIKIVTSFCCGIGFILVLVDFFKIIKGSYEVDEKAFW